MNTFKSILFISFALLLIGCGPTPESQGNNNNIELNQISTTSNAIDQGPANQAKEYLSNYEEITSIKAVNTSKKLMIAIEIEHHERFGLANFREKRKKEMKEKFPNMEVDLSTDKKIVLELDRIEKALESESVTKKELEKALDKVIGLSKEET
ncbi:hypothetical protein KFZ58_07955 [Virgibacillus sp. NKC19-16]|uniref:hypothetical protein n=1 Tax=Virgibacillus salidurans TaxID=2831673 RepID=UPI001F4048E5|nr:hypothetical protein [Virgibacillus sp. NKC19-16]UJL47774.1 hypothetical protein KFZ58_07955 [Virgibacillus sp. NKC19-16]